MTDKGINSTQAIILAVLSARPASGSVVEYEARKLEGHWNVTRSQIYRELQALAASGLLRRVSPDGEWRGKEPYEITEAGRLEFRAWFDLFRTRKLQTVTRNPWILRQKLAMYADIPETEREQLRASAFTEAQSAFLREAGREFPDPMLVRKLHAEVDWFSGALG